ncbi:hypothetical protein HanRHA438_Chr10g0438801 [Helianthus annuus]|nr:hypothetical protein HanRHA438_Chr10g0438801 [Helianthus annuus]
MHVSVLVKMALRIVCMSSDLVSESVVWVVLTVAKAFERYSMFSLAKYWQSWSARMVPVVNPGELERYLSIEFANFEAAVIDLRMERRP